MKPTDLMIQTLTEAVAALVRRMGEVESVARIAGPPPTPEEIRKAANEWLEANKDSLRGKDGDSVTPEQVQAFAVEWLSANITQPENGKDADPITAEQVQTAVDLWFEFNRESVRGEKGDAGDSAEVDYGIVSSEIKKMIRNKTEAEMAEVSKILYG